MRKAAGIILIIFGVIVVAYPSAILIGPNSGAFTPPLYPLYMIVFILTGFFITGGVYCLKRQYWAWCFTSSLVLHFSVMAASLGAIFPPLWNSFLIPGAIVPLIFICLRKSEWEEPDFLRD